MRKLTTTSYAILGLLALRPWPAYELTKQVGRSLRFCWPRAETRLYEEPKNLVEHGLAAVTVEATGRRRRSVYAITPAGRDALARWLEEPSVAPRLECEALLRVFFADQGTKQQVLETLAGLEHQADELRAQALAQGAEYLGEGPPFPERIHILGLVGRFILFYTELLAEWARFAQDEVDRWPAVTAAPVSPEVRGLFEAAVSRVTASLPESG